MARSAVPTLLALAVLCVAALAAAHAPVAPPSAAPDTPGLNHARLSTLPCADAAATANPFGPGHDHANPAQHAFGSDNFNLLGHLRATVPWAPERSWGELDAYGSRYLLNAYKDNAGGGFMLYDVSTPSAPTAVSDNHLDGFWGMDVKASKTGPFAFLGGSGIAVYSLQNPAAPSLVGIYGWTFNGVSIIDQTHMITTHLIGGREYLFSASQALGNVHVFRVNSGGSLTFLTNYNPLPGAGLGAHDTFVMDDPVLGKPLLYVADGLGGFVLADVTNPAAPVTLAAFHNAWAGDPDYHHSILATFIEGRRVIVVGGETVATEATALKLYDATNLPAVVPLGTWTAPFGHSGNGEIHDLGGSTHNLQHVDGRLYVAHYHLGVWALELDSLDDAANPPVLGYYLPHSHEPNFSAAHGPYVPMVWDVQPKDGVLYAGDMNGGLYSLRFSC